MARGVLVKEAIRQHAAAMGAGTEQPTNFSASALKSPGGLWDGKTDAVPAYASPTVPNSAPAGNAR